MFFNGTILPNKKQNGGAKMKTLATYIRFLIEYLKMY